MRKLMTVMLEYDISGKHLQPWLIEWESCETFISFLCVGIKMSAEVGWRSFLVPIVPLGPIVPVPVPPNQNVFSKDT